MPNIIYLTGFPGPAGVLDYPTLAQFPIDVGSERSIRPPVSLGHD